MLARFTPWFAGDDAFRPFFSLLDVTSPWSVGAPLQAGPQVDILAKDDGLELVCDVPGCGPDDVNVTLENGVLTIQARRAVDDANASVYRAERYRGALTRSFTLGDAYDTDRVSATLHNGVLVVRLAKRPEAAPRKIPVAFGTEPANKQLGPRSEAAESSA